MQNQSTTSDDQTPADVLVPDPTVAREFHITLMTLWRWSQDEKLGFPPAVKIRQRNYRSRRALDEFRVKMIERGIADRARTAA